MKNKLVFLQIVFISCGAIIGYGADPSMDQNQATLPDQPPEAVSQALQTKIGQVRASLSEIQNLLKQEEKILAETQNKKEKAKKNKTMSSDYDRVSDGMKREIQQLRDRIKTAEKELAAHAKQNERFSGLQVELEKAKKELADSESETRRAEEKLAALQKNLSELNNSYAELSRQANEAKALSQTLENTKALLETERSKRTESLARAEKAVAMAEKAEKERLLLTSRLSELEQSLPSQQKQQKESSEQAALLGEIEKEKQAIRESEEKINKDGKAREDAEKKIRELKIQLQTARGAARDSGKKGDLNILKEQLTGLRKQRAAAESRMKETDEILRNNERLTDELTNMLAGAENQMRQGSESSGYSARVRVQAEMENEQKAFRETREATAKKEKACEEAEKNIAALKQKLREQEKAARRDAGKEGDLNRLRSRLAEVKNQRAEAEKRLKESEENLRESEKSIAGLTDMIAAARRQEEISMETAKALAPLSGELEQETALLNEVTAGVDKQIRALKALEDEKRRLNESVVLVREKLGQEVQNTNKLDQIRLQIAAQKKSRSDMEFKFEQTDRDRKAVEEEIKQLNQALIEAGKLISQNEADSRKAGQAADELREEKELARKSTELLREKAQNVKQLEEEKEALQNRFNESEAKLARQKELIMDLAEKRRALNEEKKARVTTEKKHDELAQAEKEHKVQIKELESKVRAADKESRQLASQAVKISDDIEAGQTAAIGGSEEKETQSAQTAAEGSSGDTLATEQAVLSQARAGETQSGQQPEKKADKQTKNRSRQNKIAEAEKHYELAIQKWDGDDLDGAIEEFKKTVSLNPDAAGAYYNLSLAFLRQGKKKEACDCAYQAGECYVRINNLSQATRMSVLMTKIDKNSPHIQKLRNKIAAATK